LKDSSKTWWDGGKYVLFFVEIERADPQISENFIAARQSLDSQKLSVCEMQDIKWVEADKVIQVASTSWKEVNPVSLSLSPEQSIRLAVFFLKMVGQRHVASYFSKMGHESNSKEEQILPKKLEFDSPKKEKEEPPKNEEPSERV